MATIGTQVIANMRAVEDLSTRQYWAVTLSGSDNGAASTTSTTQPMPIGILQNSPGASQAAEVCVLGMTKMRCNTATDVACGDLITLDGSYLGAVQTTANSQFFARAFEAATTGCPVISVMWYGNHGFVGDTVA